MCFELEIWGSKDPGIELGLMWFVTSIRLGVRGSGRGRGRGRVKLRVIPNARCRLFTPRWAVPYSSVDDSTLLCGLIYAVPYWFLGEGFTMHQNWVLDRERRRGAGGALR